MIIQGVADTSNTMSGSNSPAQLEAASQRRSGSARKISHPLSEQEVKDLKIVFDVFDVDSNGYIDRNELKRAMRCLGFKVSSRTIEVSGSCPRERTIIIK